MADYATLPPDHLTLTCRSVERIFLQAYVPILRSVGGVCPVPALAEGVRDSAVGSVRQVRRRLLAKVYWWAKARMVSRCAGSPRVKTRSRSQERAATGGWCYSGSRRKRPG